ncbi:3-hydroxyacyl-CoA dehydrogenase family protein [Peredibacter starrii]|uniref:3-hydroxyacyl-CoA dehydrogenase NAD-binding domain-containing protein n=1 Tax=Peredibacter starrii TaxID=28202 RepID=A0AAX4HSF6_9BACT|nr:3-hydroxyacyl-CoA dehydrogenase NAD-binding domain-containing protein [Peredibacter starrii]WPU66295.1 3-hydroxyacyl-CoA dehydrogenase NAD-binding domain-containing protein [Peredibacter starrii]
MKLQKIVVIGAGTMGSGIAQWFTQQLCSVELVDNSQAQLEKALKDIHTSWDKLAEKGKLSNAAELKTLISIKMIDQVAKDADLVVEAIIENLEIKRELFKKLDAYFGPHTILASNTSSFPIHLMAEAVERKDKFLGLHFFNPATIMKLVEVIKGKDSSEKLCRDLYAWFDSKDKKPAFCKDSPGFIVNRVARNFYGEPLRIVDTENEAKEKEVDAILKEVGGFKMGPFELMDLIGIDVNYSVTCSVWEAYDKEPRFAPHKLQKQMVDEKRFGRKSKRGFYKYD